MGGAATRTRTEDNIMRGSRYNFLFIVGLLLTLGISTAMAADHDFKGHKGMGMLTVRTSPDPMQVKIDGQSVGMSGVGTGADFFLSPGIHTVEVIGPDGKVWTDE